MDPTTQGHRASVPEVLEARAAAGPQLAFRFLRDGTSGDQVDWTYRDLAEHAAAVAAALAERDLRGRRVLLALDPGLQYVAALFGIWQAGATAVPCFPPTGRRMQERFQSIYQDCEPDLVIADPRYADHGDRLDPRLDPTGQAPPRWLLAGDDLFTARARARAGAGGARPDPAAAVAAGHPALLQYTSGSTGRPKGVVLTHGNLVSNSLVLEHHMGYDPDRVGCSWLPPYHDMGLIGTIVLAVFSGWPLVMLSPVHFVQRPYRWLKAISDNRVTISVSPNFALDLCTATVTDEELKTLDLRSLRQVYCGAEPVLKSTLDGFRDRFAACGFRERAMIPCYGLAEATLFVSGKPDGTPVRTAWLDKAALQLGRVQPGRPGSPHATDVVSCGAVAHGHEVRIVDPATGRPAGPGGVGEIWVRGPNVAAGYFRQPAATAETFAGGGDLLRTGDLGFLRDGELHVTGRIKDLIVVAGRNLAPQDVERSARAAHDAVRNVAAFGVADGGPEELVVVVELHRDPRIAREVVDEVRRRVVAAVTADHGVRPADVYVGPAGTVRTTTSGKVQRGVTRVAYRRGELKRLHLAADRAPDRALSAR